MARLTLRQRLAMGLTVANIRRIVLEIKAHDEIDDCPPETIAAEVLAVLLAETPQAFADIDWDKVFEFVLKVVELVLQIIALFD